MDMTTAKQVRNPCKDGKIVKSAEFVTKLCSVHSMHCLAVCYSSYL